MRFARIAPLLPLASALVITEPEVFQSLEKSGRKIIDNAQNVLDDAFERVKDSTKDLAEDAYRKIHHAGCDVDSWLKSGMLEDSEFDPEEDPRRPPFDSHPPFGKPPHGGPPRDGPPRDGPPHGGPPPDGPSRDGPPHDEPPHGKPPGKGPKHDRPPFGKPPHDGPPRDGPPRDGPPRGKPPGKGPKHDKPPFGKPPHGKPPQDGPSHDGPPHDGPPHDGPHGKPPGKGPKHDRPPFGKPPHDGPPRDGPPRDGPPHGKPPHKGPKHGKPHHPPHHGKPNQTVYELINSSKYTTKLAKLINKFDDLVETLNSTSANYTIFAPTDEAFEKLPHHHKKHPSKEFLKSILSYHVAPGFYPAGRVLHSYTIPTLYEPELLGHKQRLTVRVTLKGPTINFYSRIVAVDIFGTNGVIHGLDSLLLPPPPVHAILDLLPGEFSTLDLALEKTGLSEKLNGTEYPHEGGTFFAPSNFAFKKLGPKANGFLFSKFGTKYLKALLEYHIVVNRTLYSDAFFDATKDSSTEKRAGKPPPYFHFDLPTVLPGGNLAVDVTRFGPFVTIRINGFSRVTVHDGVASDGVIQVVSDVLIPPKNAENGEQIFWEGEELEVEDLKERLEPLTESVEQNEEEVEEAIEL